MNPLKIVIPGPLPGLNEYVKANQGNEEDEAEQKGTKD